MKTLMKQMYSIFIGLLIALSNTALAADSQHEPSIKYWVDIENLSQSGSSSTPITFGQIFKKGDIPNGYGFKGYLQGGDVGQIIALQTNKKALYDDGSLKHAVFTAMIPKLSSIPSSLRLYTEPYPSASSLQVTPPLAELLTMLDVKATINMDADSGGGTYEAEASKHINSETTLWLNGEEATEWIVKAPFIQTNSNTAHPHLVARFAIRFYKNAGIIKVDNVIENGWAFTPAPQMFKYDITFKNGLETKTIKALEHFRQARYRVTTWNKPTPQPHIKHNTKQLIATKAIPNYDPSLIGNISSVLIDEYKAKWNPETIKTEKRYGFEWNVRRYGPMGFGFAQPYMPAPGGRPDIGPLPRWTAAYILNQDHTSKTVALGMGNIAGSWAIHYRDNETDLPISVEDRPKISLISGSFPESCGDNKSRKCLSPYVPDNAHTPSFAYVPYIVTGEHYYLEELNFWVAWTIFRFNYAYRGETLGLVHRSQVRAQGWMLRELARAAYINPDDHKLKGYFDRLVKNNIKHYTDTYIPASGPLNTYGALKHSWVDGKVSPWMDDFFTWSLGSIVDLGYDSAKPLLQWKAKFPVKRMGFTNKTPDAYCWIYGAAYQLHVTTKENTKADMFKTIEEVYNYTGTVERSAIKHPDLACNSPEQNAALKLPPNVMTGYPNSPEGFPANMQPALATAASDDVNIEKAKDAWLRFESRGMKPDYTKHPVWAIVPRKSEARPTAFTNENWSVK